MKPYKIVLIVVAVLIGLGGAGVMWFNKLTGPIFGAGTAFVTQIAAQGPDAAYASASPVFQTQTSRQGFASLSIRLHLADLDHVGWSSMNITGSNGTIGGTATLKSGTEVPMELTLVKQKGIWMVTGLTVPGGLSTGGGNNQPKN
jgi:hypothetical protein